MNYPRSHVRGIHAFNPSQISQASPSHRTKLQTYAQNNRVKQSNSSKRDDSYSRRVAAQAHAANLDSDQNAPQNPEMEKRLRSLVTQVQKEDTNRVGSGTQFFRKLELNSLLIRQKQQQQQEQQIAAQQANMPIGATTCPVGGNNILGPQIDQNIGRKTLVLDLDETLVHSSFKPVDDADIVLPVQIEGNICYVYVLIRPGAQYFLERMAPLYEVVIYTASLSKYADPLLEKLDKTKAATYRLFREHCIFYNGVFVKDLSRLGRNLKDVIIIDNSPASYALNPECALPSISWYDDMECHELHDMIPILEFLQTVDDVRPYLKRIVKNNTINYAKAMDSLRKEQRRSSTVSAEANHRRNLSHSQQIQLQPQLSPEQQRRGGQEDDDDHKIRHTSLDTRRKPLMNTWTPSSLQKEKAQALHNNVSYCDSQFQQTATPMILSANLQDQQGYGGAHRPTTTSGSSRAVAGNSTGYGYREHGSNALRASYNGTSGHQKQPLSQVLGPSYQQYGRGQDMSHHPTHQRGHSAGAGHRSNNQRVNKHQVPSTTQGSSRKVTSSSTNTIRRAIQLNDVEMKYQGSGGGTGGAQNVSNTPSSVLTAETAMPSSQVNERKISLGNQTPSHHSNTPSITSSTRPLMINLNRPASTKHHNSGMQSSGAGGARAKMPGFFQKGMDRDSEGRGGYSASGQYQYNKGSGTPKTMKSASIGGTGGSKKGVHYHTLTQGSGYAMIPSSTRAHTASTRPTTSGSVFDVYMNQTGPQDFNNTTSLAMAMNVQSPSQSAVVNSTQFSGGSMKYGNLLKLSMGEEVDQRGSSVGPEKMSGQTRHNSLPRNEKNSTKRIKTSKWKVKLGSEKVRRSMKLGTPKYGSNGGIPVELNPRTTTAGYVHHNAGGYTSGISTNFLGSSGYSHQQGAIHHPSTANTFISGTGMQNRSQLQKHHQHHHSSSAAANPRENGQSGQSKKALVRVARPSSGKKNQSMSAAISTNGATKKGGNTGPAGFFGDFFAVRNAQNKELRGPVVVARADEPKNTELYSRFNS